MSLLASKAKEEFLSNSLVYTEFLRLKTVPMIKYLFDEQILEVKDAEKSISQAAATMKACHMLDSISKEPISLEKIYAATLYVKAWKAADLLEPDESPHQQRDEEPPIPLPDKWPSNDDYKDLKSEQINVETVESTDERMIKYFNRSSKFNIYEMNKKEKGRALIINNSKFKSFTERKGSEHDRDGLKTLLTKLGLRVEIHENKTKDEMMDILNKEAELDHSEFQCFFLFILSHGGEGVVYGTDGMPAKNRGKRNNFIIIEKIRNIFEQVKSLQRKPKVLIIQACQGVVRDPGVTVTGAMEEEQEEEEKAEKGKDDNEQFKLKDLIDDPNSKFNTSLSLLDDEPYHVLIALPTTPGNLSFRGVKSGSWFIQAFIFVLAKYAYKEHLTTLMEKVNKLVSTATKKTGRKTPGKQTSQTKHTFLKKFYFFPGMSLLDRGPLDETPAPPGGNL